MTLFHTKEYAPNKGETVLDSLLCLLYQAQHLARGK